MILSYMSCAMRSFGFSIKSSMDMATCGNTGIAELLMPLLDALTGQLLCNDRMS